MNCYRCNHKAEPGASAYFLRNNRRMRLRLCDECFNVFVEWWKSPSVRFVDVVPDTESVMPPPMFEIGDM